MPSNSSLFVIENPKRADDFWVELPEEICDLSLLAYRDVSVKILGFSKRKEWVVRPNEANRGLAIWLLTPKVFRGQYSADRIKPTPDDLVKRYCNPDEYGIDSSHSTVQDTVRQILDSLPLSKRDNPLFRARAAFDWVKQNIGYSIVPKGVIERVAKNIDRLPPEKKCDPFSILYLSFNLREDLLRKVADYIPSLSPADSSIEKAKRLMLAASNAWGIFQFAWWGGECNASKIIESRMGKCVGFSNAFIALCRVMKIPAIPVGGWAGGQVSGGDHAWALVNLHPYGWREVDPTISKSFDEFSYNDYGYEFYRYKPSGRAILIPGAGDYSSSDIERWQSALGDSRSFSMRRLLGLKELGPLVTAEEILRKARDRFND